MDNNYVSFTYIISYRHSSERLNLLKRTLEWINGFSNSQVILVEQDRHSKIANLSLTLNCEHIFIKSDKPFNRSWGFNVGYKYAKSNVVVFGDSDIIMGPNDFINSIKLLQQYEVVSPYNSVIDLNPQENNLSFGDILKISRPGRGDNDNQKINMSGGIVIFRKDSIMKIGGWPEEFWGWGGEDDFQTMKIEKLLTWYVNKAKCYHLYHNKAIIESSDYNNNLAILNKFVNMDKNNFIKYINSVIPKVGRLNKCIDI